MVWLFNRQVDWLTYNSPIKLIIRDHMSNCERQCHKALHVISSHYIYAIRLLAFFRAAASLTLGPSNLCIITLRSRQNGRHFADDSFKCIILNENVQISLKVFVQFVPKVRINNIPSLVQIMAWRRPGDKPLSEPMMVHLLTHICVTRPQWLKGIKSQWTHITV